MIEQRSNLADDFRHCGLWSERVFREHNVVIADKWSFRDKSEILSLATLPAATDKHIGRRVFLAAWDPVVTLPLAIPVAEVASGGPAFIASKTSSVEVSEHGTKARTGIAIVVSDIKGRPIHSSVN
jgi:hypothetical protein